MSCFSKFKIQIVPSIGTLGKKQNMENDALNPRYSMEFDLNLLSEKNLLVTQNGGIYLMAGDPKRKTVNGQLN